MKTFDRFIEQIEKTKQRFQLHSGEDLGAVKTIIHPKQVHNYLKAHNLKVTELINDRQLRERVIKGDDTLDVNYLEKGTIAAKSVCRIHINDAQGDEGFGTGFLIAPQILITNNHVLPTLAYATYSFAEFNYENGTDDLPLPSKLFRFNSSKMFYTNEELDYTIVWVEDRSTDGLGFLDEFNYLKLNPNLGKTKEGNYVSIIQHPDGRIKKVAIRQNEITNLSLPKFIRYVTDTKSGSSGAPVFNDKWEVVSVHHAGIPRYNIDGKILNLAGEIWDKSQGEVQVDWLENEGVRVSSIVYDMTTVAAHTYPFLLNYFKPLTDLEDIRRSMGISIADLENETYYPKSQDVEQQQRYYSNLEDPEHASVNELHALLELTHTAAPKYNPSKYLYLNVDLHPDGQLKSIYSNKDFTTQELILADQKIDIDRQLQFIELVKNEKTLGLSAFNEAVEKLESAMPYNCEHVICQSWFKKQEPMRGDLHHLFACESSCNSFRNDFPYHEFPAYQPELTPLDDKEQSACGYVQDELFEPEHNKGIVARAVFYFLVRYPGVIKIYKPKEIEILKNWAAQQPVTLYEKHRNHEISLIQGNRNPFIDFPELIQSINFNV
ncbi:endonuclease [Pedobacter sp.]|uniref:endonuclease n=1 Tax=Pedobacter sp. TaxID=1411316 RepID=UPI003D7F41F3